MSASPALRLSCMLCCCEDLEELVGGAYRRCPNCSLIFQALLPANPIGLYRRENYDKARSDVGHGIGVFQRFNHDYTVGRLRLRQLALHLPRATHHSTWTDFGCGNAALLCAARNSGFHVRGVELDPDMCEELLAITGVRCIPTADFFRSPGSYPTTVFSLFDVLEHLISPVNALRLASDSLDANGIIVIEVPDVSQRPDDVPFESWKHTKPDEHIQFFSPLALEVMRERFFPEFERIHEDVPVPEKLQVIWRKQG